MSENNTKFHYSLNSNIKKDIIMKVYNTYIEYVEYQSSFTLDPNVNYWTGLYSNLKNRYVEFRDADTFDIVGRRTDTSGDYAAFYVKGLASNIAGTTSDIGSVYEVVIARTDTSFQVDVRADNTTDTINVYVTGSTGKTISWKCSVTTTEV